MFQEYVAGRLRWIDANTVIGNDRTCFWWHLELKAKKVKYEKIRLPTQLKLQTGTITSSAAYFSTAVNGVCSGTLSILNGNLGSEVRVILKDTFVVAL